MPRPDKPRETSSRRLTLSDETRLTAGHAHHRAPAWSRDGRLLAIAVGGEHDASWVIVDRRGRVARALEGPAGGTASFAPDGSLAFERRFGETSEIWLTPGGDAPPVRLLGGDGRLYRDPAFSPDGKLLACATASERGAGTQLMLVRLADGHRVMLTEPQGGAAGPSSASPGSGPEAIVGPAAAARSDLHPVFTPDGSELVFEGVVGVDHGVYALSLAGASLQRLTPPDERARRPTALAQALVVYERQPENGPSALVLLDRARARAHTIAEGEAWRGEPACFVGEGGKIKLAYAALPPPGGAGSKHGKRRAVEPARFDVFTARLRGVPSRKDAGAGTPAGAAS